MVVLAPRLVAAMQGEFARAREHHTRALAIGEKALGPEHPDNAYTLTGLGEALLGLDDAGAALPHLERALSLRSSTTVEPIELAKTRFALARALVSGGERERARELAALAHEVFLAQGATRELAACEAWRGALED